MKRRHFFETIAVAPAATVAVAQQSALAQAPAAAAATADARPQTAIADDAASGVTGFFSPEQFAALRKLSDVVFPALNGKPGALDAGAAEFLDFLISESPERRQRLYGEGLNQLNAAARGRYQKGFGELDSTQAAALLEPLKQPWTFDPPQDPLAHFLREAKADIRTATLNSKEYITAASAGGRRGGGTGAYMLPLD
jgi:hypothetical protein